MHVSQSGRFRSYATGILNSISFIVRGSSLPDMSVLAPAEHKYLFPVTFRLLYSVDRVGGRAAVRKRRERSQ